MNEQNNNETYWEGRMDYLRDSRNHLWNPDYFSFLVERVWKIDKPIKVLDFGCGMGYLGSVLLPLLPESSTYTGLDIGAKLLEEGRTAFAGSPWAVDFIGLLQAWACIGMGWRFIPMKMREPTKNYMILACKKAALTAM